MISATPQEIAVKIKAEALRSITGIASHVKPDQLLFIATHIANAGEWIPPDVSGEWLRQRLTRLAAEMPDRFYPEIFPND
jgi:hypothetical protein